MINKMVRVSRLTLLLALALLLPFAGCKSEEEKVYQDAYEANRKAGYQDGFQQGEARGTKQGDEEGRAEALAAVETGEAWQLYRALALGALAAGLMFGLAIQYGLMLVCRRTGNLPQFSMVAFIPAMKSTVVYAVFERRRDLIIEIDEQLREMAERKNLQVAQIEQVKEAIALKIKALSSLDDYSQARLLELAAEEMEKIVSGSARKAEAGADAPSPVVESDPGQMPTRVTHICPSCQTWVRFSLRSANEAVTCPNQGCGQLIRLPPALHGADGAPLILDVDD
jgi:hypothetical protein